VPSILYLHGFASSPKSAKVQALRDLLPEIDLITPDLNEPSFAKLDFYANVEKALNAAKNPVAIVGSSLGALMALEVVRRGLKKPMVLIAPALGVADRWITRVPDGDPVIVYNHALAKDVPIHRAFFEQMKEVDADRNNPPVPVTLVMGRQDESVPFERVRAVWQQWESSGNLVAGSSFIEIENGDHSLTAFAATLAREIRRAVALGSGILDQSLEP
jgi:predicted esterase YcpF (UPF0227 family)